MGEITPFMLFSNRCPNCGQGRIMKSFLEMHEVCGVCGQRFIQESGQHWGAMVLSYVFAAMISLPIFAVLIFHSAPTLIAVGVPTLVLAVLSPFMVRFTRLAWMHIMLVIGAHAPRKD